MNENKKVAEIKWKEEGLSDSEQKTSIEKFPKTKYNPKKKFERSMDIRPL